MTTPTPTAGRLIAWLLLADNHAENIEVPLGERACAFALRHAERLLAWKRANFYDQAAAPINHETEVRSLENFLSILDAGHAHPNIQTEGRSMIVKHIALHESWAETYPVLPQIIAACDQIFEDEVVSEEWLGEREEWVRRRMEWLVGVMDRRAGGSRGL